MEYFDFVLNIKDAGDGRFELSAQSDTMGHATGVVSFALDSPQMAAAQQRLADGPIDRDFLTTIGGTLSDALFTGEVRDLYHESLGRVQHDDDKGLRLRLCIPNLIGDSRDHAVEDIRDERLQVGEIQEQPGCEPGRVIAQSPQKDTRVPEGSVVSMTVAVAGPRAVPVPQVAGLHQARAEATLRERGLRAGRVNRTETDRQPPETVIAQAPRPNAMLPPGCPVDLEVAAPIPLVIVPRFVGLTEEQARQRLPRGVVGAFSPLRLGEVTYRDYATVYGTTRRAAAITVPTVIEQRPAADTQVRRGTAVDLVVLRPPVGDQAAGIRRCAAGSPNTR